MVITLKVDCRPEGYLSFLHPACRESPALASEGPLGDDDILVMSRFVWSLTVRRRRQQADEKISETLALERGDMVRAQTSSWRGGG